MSSEHSLYSWPSYTAFVNALAQVDSGYEWLAAFFSQTSQGRAPGGQCKILESHGDVVERTVKSLDHLNISPPASTTRIVVLSYKEAWSLDRKLLDRVAMALNLSPYFLWQHLEYPNNYSENACADDVRASGRTRPSAAASDTMSLEVGWTSLFHMSAIIASPRTKSTGPVG